MTWIIIILILAVAIGPVLYLLPNAKDKRLMALREQARRLGFTVKITSLPRLDPSAGERVTAGGKTLDPRQNCVAYKIPIRQRLYAVDNLLLLKIPDAPTVLVNEVMSGWTLDGDSSLSFWQRYRTEQATPEAVIGRLQAAFAKLPGDTLGVAIDSRFVSCYWLEKASPDSGMVDRIHQVLDGLREDLGARFGTTA